MLQIAMNTMLLCYWFLVFKVLKLVKSVGFIVTMAAYSLKAATHTSELVGN